MPDFFTYPLALVFTLTTGVGVGVFALTFASTDASTDGVGVFDLTFASTMGVGVFDLAFASTFVSTMGVGVFALTGSIGTKDGIDMDELTEDVGSDKDELICAEDEDVDAFDELNPGAGVLNDGVTVVFLVGSLAVNTDKLTDGVGVFAFGVGVFALTNAFTFSVGVFAFGVGVFAFTFSVGVFTFSVGVFALTDALTDTFASNFAPANGSHKPVTLFLRVFGAHRGPTQLSEIGSRVISPAHTFRQRLVLGFNSCPSAQMGGIQYNNIFTHIGSYK